VRLGRKIICTLTLGLGIGQAESAASLTVLVYNHANVPGAKLLEAEAFAARSYRAAGIELTWVECAASESDTGRFRACELANDGRGLFLRIIPERMVAGIRRSRQTDNVFGIALVFDAFVLYPRVLEMARVWGVPEYLILGRTMAHELGHLLLGPDSHAASGLMRPQFGWRDLSPASGQFLFDPQQAKRLAMFSHRWQK